MTTTRATLLLLAVILALMAAIHPAAPVLAGTLATVTGLAVCVTLSSTLARDRPRP